MLTHFCLKYHQPRTSAKTCTWWSSSQSTSSTAKPALSKASVSTFGTWKRNEQGKTEHNGRAPTQPPCDPFSTSYRAPSGHHTMTANTQSTSSSACASIDPPAPPRIGKIFLSHLRQNSKERLVIGDRSRGKHDASSREDAWPTI